MKVALLGDCHMGARSGSNHYSQHFNKFFDEIFYPYLIEHNIKEVIQLGDIFDNRTTLSIKAFNACKHSWFEPLATNDITMHILLGNHDVFHKSSVKINSPDLFLKEYTNVKVYGNPAVIDLYDTTFALVPWICDENREAIYDFMNRDKIADICCGHFEIDGFEMMRGIAGHGGLPRSLFDKFEVTFSGHYHTRSYDEVNRILYVGTPYEITFADMHDPRGFHVFDTDTRQITVINNPYTMFDRIVYNDGWTGDVNSLNGKAVKLIVEKKNDLYAFDRFVDSVKLADVYDLQIIENFNDLKNVDVDENISVENSQTIINHYIDQLTTSVNKDSLKDFMNGLYVEAINA